MASTICSSSSCFAWKTIRQKSLRTNYHNTQNLVVHSSLGSAETSIDDSTDKLHSGLIKRRSLILQSGVVPLLSSLAVFEFPAPGLAVVKQGLLPGRVPGLSEPDEEDRLENISQTRRQVWRTWCGLESYHPLRFQSPRRLG